MRIEAIVAGAAGRVWPLVMIGGLGSCLLLTQLVRFAAYALWRHGARQPIDAAAGPDLRGAS